MAGQGRRLILVRHSLPEMVTGVPASQWHLSAEGRHRCEKLAERLADYSLAAVVASEESKAAETGQTIARILDLPFETATGLHEHQRGVIMDLGSREGFQAQVARFFEHPDDLVLGYETADEVYARFATAVSAVLERHPHGNLAIVCHGTVISLFIARANHLDPFPFWKRLGLPAFAVLSLPDLDLLEVMAGPTA
ncbi:MAG TPA: histidine phosphatase family protein [Anaerolineae bacterium]|nr:histidine phosphatase family protein [Anaerolineae bacterium]